METFEEFNISRQLLNAADDLGFETPTAVQEEAFNVILSGKDMVGISQTGTGKTYAYMLPILHEFKFSKQITPRVLIMVPTRELVAQVVEKIESYAKYMTIRVLGVYGGANINTQMQSIMQGCDILVATPGRLYDLALSNTLKLRDIKKVVIDEVDIMLDLGFRPQLTNIFEILPERRQHIMFSATMTEEVDELIENVFIEPAKISIAVSGTPLDNISQTAYAVPNFYTKVNLLVDLIKDKDKFTKVLVFASNKKTADRIYETIEPTHASQTCIIHGNKSQNYRFRSVDQFESGEKRIMIATDVMARGLDIDDVSHVFNFDVPTFPENYMHRIGRTGRAEKEGESVLFHTPAEEEYKLALEVLMNYEIPKLEIPEKVEISTELIPEERPLDHGVNNPNRNFKKVAPKSGFHEKKEKNKKENLGGSYKRTIKKKYKKPKTKGDKGYNRRYKK